MHPVTLDLPPNTSYGSSRCAFDRPACSTCLRILLEGPSQHAVRILAICDVSLRERMEMFQADLTVAAAAKGEALRDRLRPGAAVEPEP